jgi:hypothetical protein
MVEKQRDAKVAEAATWAARLQEVQDDCNTQMSYQQIEIQVCECRIVCRMATFAQLPSSFSQALHQRSHDLSQQLQVRSVGWSTDAHAAALKVIAGGFSAEV